MAGMAQGMRMEIVSEAADLPSSSQDMLTDPYLCFPYLCFPLSLLTLLPMVRP